MLSHKDHSDYHHLSRDHGHDGNYDGEKHYRDVHEERPMVEERAIQREGPTSPGQELLHAFYRLDSLAGV